VPITEPLEGSDARFLRAVVGRQPALIVFDLRSTTLPWEWWIQILNTSSATRRIPFLAFAPHVEARRLQRAFDLGVVKALPRGSFLAALRGYWPKHALRQDPGAIEAACQGDLDARVVEGIHRVQVGDYLGGHEHLEDAVLGTIGPEAVLYRVLLQVTVAYLHLERGNLRGARKMMLRLRGWLAPLPNTCRGVDVARLRAQLDEPQAALDAEALDPSVTIPAHLLRPTPLQGASGKL
jgi:hypothetical protein